MRIVVISNRSFRTTELTGVKAITLRHDTDEDYYVISFENTSRESVEYTTVSVMIQILNG